MIKWKPIKEAAHGKGPVLIRAKGGQCYIAAWDAGADVWRSEQGMPIPNPEVFAYLT